MKSPTRDNQDERFMRLAINEAAKGVGRTAPNPAVGAVIVRNERVIARGYHHATGLPHAEIEAIRKAGFDPDSLSPMTHSLNGSTLYVTLEPCSSHGRTPPCTEAIISAGINRVVYGATDPDKRHRGRAAKILNKAGIKVTKGILEKECEDLNSHWNHRAATGLPWIIAKAGMSLDGRIDSPPHRRWITSSESRREVMRLRTKVEAILVGGGTARADDPSLTIRGIKLPKGHPQPWRIVLSRTGKIPKTSKLLTDKHRDRTLLFNGLSLEATLRKLSERGISSVLIEGGGRTLGEAFDRNLVDEVCIFIAPVIQGGNIPAVGGAGVGSSIPPIKLRDIKWKRINSDLMLSAKTAKSRK